MHHEVHLDAHGFPGVQDGARDDVHADHNCARHPFVGWPAKCVDIRAWTADCLQPRRARQSPKDAGKDAYHGAGNVPLRGRQTGRRGSESPGGYGVNNENRLTGQPERVQSTSNAHSGPSLRRKPPTCDDCGCPAQHADAAGLATTFFGGVS